MNFSFRKKGRFQAQYLLAAKKFEGFCKNLKSIVSLFRAGAYLPHRQKGRYTGERNYSDLCRLKTKEGELAPSSQTKHNEGEGKT